MPKKPHHHTSEEIYQTAISIFFFDPNHQVSVSVYVFRENSSEMVREMVTRFRSLEERNDSLFGNIFLFSACLLSGICLLERPGVQV